MVDVHKKLLKVQTGLVAPKSNKNDFGNYYYRSCEDILEALKPHLEEVGATVTVSDSLELIGDRFYIKAIATFTDTESRGTVQVSAYAREEESKRGMDGAQVTGASSSYARKYALNGLFCIDDTKDADVTNDHGKAKKKNSPSKPAPKKQAPATKKPAAKETRDTTPPAPKQESTGEKPISATQKKAITNTVVIAGKQGVEIDLDSVISEHTGKSSLDELSFEDGKKIIPILNGLMRG